MSEDRKEYYQQYAKANKENIKENKKQYREANKEKLKEYHQQYAKANKEKIKENQKQYQEANKEKLKEYKKIYIEANKEKIKEKDKQYREANKEKLSVSRKKYKEANKEKIKEKDKQYREANKEKAKQYREANKEKLNKWNNQYCEARRLVDPLFKMRGNLSSRTYKAFKYKGYKKTSQTQEMLGVDWEVCKAHIERQFKKGMKWRNQGEWHIDHIIPLASAKNEKELRKLCHYRNLQPLWAVDNLNKSDKIIGQQSFMRI